MYWFRDYSQIKIDDKNRDIYLKEYESATKQLELEERLFSNTVSLSSILVTIFTTLFITNLESTKRFVSKFSYIKIDSILLLFTVLIMLFSSTALKYFATKTRSIISSRRKVVLIRGLMNCDYGNFSAILPNWTVHGATNPFSIRVGSSHSYFIFLLISTVSASLLFFLTQEIQLLKVLNNEVITLVIVLSILCFYRAFSVKKMTPKQMWFTVGYIVIFESIYFAMKKGVISASWINSHWIIVFCISLVFAIFIELVLNSRISVERSIKNLLFLSMAIFLNSYIYNFLSGLQNTKTPASISLLISISWFLYCWLVYQKNLFDKLENFILFFGKKIAFILNYKLHHNMIFKTYQAMMAVSEIKRLNVSLVEIKKIAIEIEDRRFIKREDVTDIRSLLRAVYSILSKRKIIPDRIKKRFKIFNNISQFSGGSTIPQQLFRTLYSAETSLAKKKLRRKFLELYFSYWLLSIFSKDEILDLYLASVRYEKGQHGILSAIKYFFGDGYFFRIQNFNLTPAQSFFLVERLSNTRSKFFWDKIKLLIKRLHEEIGDDGKVLLSNKDIQELICLYKKAIDRGKILVSCKIKINKSLNDFSQNYPA